MPRRVFLQALATALLLLAALNFAVGWLGRNAVPRVIVRSIENAPPITHLFLGNSLVQAGFSSEDFTRSAEEMGAVVQPFNAGLGWSTAAEHIVLWDQVRARGQHPKMVFYGFFDFQLHSEIFDAPWWKLDGNLAMAYYVDPALAARYHAPGSLIGLLFMRTAKFVPLFTERSTFWGKVELARRWLNSLGMRRDAKLDLPTDTPRDSFQALESRGAQAFEHRCREIVSDEIPFLPAVRDLIKSVRESGAELFFVEMPMPPAHRQTFYAQPGWSAYKTQLSARLRAEGVDFIEAGSWIADPASFADSLHLNRAGAQQFTEKLAAQVLAPDTRLRAP